MEFVSKPEKEEISDAKKAYLTDAKPHFALICVINVKTANKFTISRKIIFYEKKCINSSIFLLQFYEKNSVKSTLLLISRKKMISRKKLSLTGTKRTILLVPQSFGRRVQYFCIHQLWWQPLLLGPYPKGMWGTVQSCLPKTRPKSEVCVYCKKK